MACKAIWCGSCYTAPKEVDFYHFTPSDEAGYEWVVLKDLARHCYARAGDHIVTPFQCNLCSFCTLMQRNPASQDTLLILCIRQVNLDTLWGHETAMVNSTKCSIDKLLNLWSTLGISFSSLTSAGASPFEGYLWLCCSHHYGLQIPRPRSLCLLSTIQHNQKIEVWLHQCVQGGVFGWLSRPSYHWGRLPQGLSKSMPGTFHLV
jgi:hypothetical protein